MQAKHKALTGITERNKCWPGTRQFEGSNRGVSLDGEGFVLDGCWGLENVIEGSDEKR